MMKRNSIALGAGAVLLALASCSSFDDSMNDGLVNTPNDITVSTYVGPTSRANAKTAFVEGDELGLYACRTTGKYAGSFTDNFMRNVKVTKGTADWTYSPLMAWPTDPNEHLTFVAFYPYSSSSSGLSYPFTVDLDYKKQTDLLYCTIQDANITDRNGTAINGNTDAAAFEAASGALPLKFQHMLSKVNVSVKLSSNYPGVTAKLNYLSLSNVYSNGTLNLREADLSPYWSAKGSKNFSIFSDAAEEAKVLSSTPTFLTEMHMIPQPVAENDAYFYIKYTHTLAEGGEREVTKNINLPGQWDINKAYHYVINLDLDVNTITITAEVTDNDATYNPSVGNQAPEAVDMGGSVLWAKSDYDVLDPYAPGKEQGGSFTSFSWPDVWRKPTKEEWEELLNASTITEEEHYGHTVYKVTNKTTGASLFFANDEYWTSTRSFGEDYYWSFLQNVFYKKSPSYTSGLRLVMDKP